MERKVKRPLHRNVLAIYLYHLSKGLAILLNTSLTKGLNEEYVDKQRNDFGRNDFPSKEMDSWYCHAYLLNHLLTYLLLSLHIYPGLTCFLNHLKMKL